jgi:UDP-N-acetylmuramyl tripeptide synthase
MDPPPGLKPGVPYAPNRADSSPFLVTAPKFTRTREPVRSQAMGARLAVETAVARAAAGLSRLAGRGGGTTLPGKLLRMLDPGAIDALAARLPQGSALVSATNGKTTTTAMAARILGDRTRLAWNSAGANLVSGVATALVAGRGAQLGLFEVDEAALPEVARRLRPRAVLLGNLFRDQLDRYGELEHVAEGWRDAVAGLSGDAVVVLGGDDPLVADLRGAVAGRTILYGLDDPAVARPALQHAADSKYCLRCGAPYAYDAAYVGHLGDYRCTACGHERPSLDVAARRIEPDGLRGVSFDLVTGVGETRVTLPLPGLYNVYNAVAAGALAQALGATLDEIRTGLEGFSAAFGRFERIPAGEKTLLVLLVKNPAGANEVIRTLEPSAPRVLLIALNDATADGKDVSWIWDVDLEPLIASAQTIVASGDRAAELAVRLLYGGLERSALLVEPDLERALDRGLALVPPGGELPVLPTYTAMLALRGIVAQRGLVTPYWLQAPV